MSGPAIVLLAAAAVCLVVAYLFNVMAMRHGEIGFVSPFRYTVLIWAIVLGVVVFGDIPNVMILVGSAIVVAMGVFTFYRERSLAHRLIAGEADLQERRNTGP